MRELGIPNLLGSKLAISRGLGPETLTSTLAQECALPDNVDENHLYAAMDWLLPRQARIEKALAARHLQEGSLVLYNLTLDSGREPGCMGITSYFEGKTCPLAHLGHSRDGKKGKLQIDSASPHPQGAAPQSVSLRSAVYGLLCNRHGTPVAVEVFGGNTADPMTLGAQIKKLRGRFGIQRLILVGDRGMITQARIDQELRDVEGLDWMRALRSSQIAELSGAGLIQPSLFDEKNLAEIQSPDFPGERLVVCRNPLLARSRAHKREELLAATEADLEKIRSAVLRAKAPVRGAARIGLRVGRVIGKHKMAKHFDLQISDTTFSYSRRSENIAREAAIDGLYVVRAKVTDGDFTPSQLVERYKDLSLVENAFRSIKTVDLKVRTIHHRDEDRVRCHVFLCILAYYVEWHMRAALKTVLFDEDDHEAARAERPDVVAPKKPSPSAKRKACTKRCPDGLPVHSFQTLLEDLATITRNTIVPNLVGAPGWQQDTEPTPLQAKIIKLLKNHTMP